jgi:hypothetical protein
MMMNLFWGIHRHVIHFPVDYRTRMRERGRRNRIERRGIRISLKHVYMYIYIYIVKYNKNRVK